MRFRVAVLAMLAALAGCTHGDAFSIATTGSDLPFNTVPPFQLTFSPGTDQDPSWLPDESGILYSADRPDEGGDRCLELLPPTGGQARRSFCSLTLASRDSINSFDAAAANASGDLAYVRASRPPQQAGPRFVELAIAHGGDILHADSVQAIPFSPGGVTMNDVAQVRWLDGQSLVYRGGFRGTVCVGPPGQSSPCPLALVRTGRALVRQSLGSPPVLVPGTSQATSVAVDRDPDVIFFTLVGDGRIYREVLSTSTVTVVHDFGATIARDVQVSGSRAVAVVGGTVQVLDPALNPGAPPLQYDSGGILMLVELATGAETQLTSPLQRFHTPALSPSGKHLVAELNGDLWLMELP